jgi:hypothetical protein
LRLQLPPLQKFEKKETVGFRCGKMRVAVSLLWPSELRPVVPL